MRRFFVLLTMTEQGLRHIDKSPERAAAFRKQVEAAGGKVEALYWTVGQFDGAVIFQAPDDEIATALIVSLGRQGNVRTHTMRAFEPVEFQRILAHA